MGGARAERGSSKRSGGGQHHGAHRRHLRAVDANIDVGAISPGFRIWLQTGGQRVFGPGIHELLEHVDATGSLHQSAKLMGMSYTKAWHALRRTEERLGWRLVERRAGGVSGGGMTLTPTGRELVERYAAFIKELEAVMQSAFVQSLGRWNVGREERDTL